MAVIRLTDRTGSWRTRLAAPLSPLSPLCLAFWTLHSRWLAAAALEPANKHCEHSEHCQLRFSHDSTRSVSAAAAPCECVCRFLGLAAGKFLTRTWQLLYQGQGNDISGTQQHHAQWARDFSKENLPQHLVKTLSGFPTVFGAYPWRGLQSNYAASSGKSNCNMARGRFSIGICI